VSPYPGRNLEITKIAQLKPLAVDREYVHPLTDGIIGRQIAINKIALDQDITKAIGQFRCIFVCRRGAPAPRPCRLTRPTAAGGEWLVSACLVDLTTKALRIAASAFGSGLVESKSWTYRWPRG
jgi:hypothetical protein